MSREEEITSPMSLVSLASFQVSEIESITLLSYDGGRLGESKPVQKARGRGAGPSAARALMRGMPMSLSTHCGHPIGADGLYGCLCKTCSARVELGAHRSGAMHFSPPL